MHRKLHLKLSKYGQGIIPKTYTRPLKTFDWAVAHAARGLEIAKPE